MSRCSGWRKFGVFVELVKVRANWKVIVKVHEECKPPGEAFGVTQKAG